MRTFAPMNFTSQMRHNPDTGEDEKYYRLKESYRDAMGRSCSRTLLNVGFIHGLKPEEIRDISRGLTCMLNGILILCHQVRIDSLAYGSNSYFVHVNQTVSSNCF